MAKHKVRLTKAAIEGLRCPAEQDRIYVYDTLASGLCVRVGRGGRTVFVWSGRKAGRPTRITLGRFPLMSLEQARRAAHEVAGKADRESRALQKRYTLQEAFDEALAASSRGEHAREDWHRAVRAFTTWITKRYPQTRFWNDLDRTIVKEYLATRDGLSDTTRRLALQPICQTSKFMHLEHETRHFAESLGIGSKLLKTPAAVYLRDVAEFLDFLRENNPALEAGAALQGLAGLQLLEALRLTWDKIDLERGLIEVSGEVKNVYRNRVIPIPSRALEALQRAKARPMTGEQHVVLSERGHSFEGSSALNYSKRLKRAMLAWNPQCEWAAKDLRNALPTYAAQSGILCLAWEQYAGHAARGVTGRHYVPKLASGTIGEADALSEQMNVFRRLVVEPIEKALQHVGAAIVATDEE